MAEQRTLKIKKMDPEKNDQLVELFPIEKDGYICVGDEGYVFPNRFGPGLEKIHNMDVRPDDIFVVTFPRSGTTWSQELVWLVANEYDFETAKSTPLTERYPFLEFSLFQTPESLQKLREEAKTDENKKKLLAEMGAVEDFKNLPSPRFLKTHLPLSILPPELLDTSKVVYVARDARDVCVSFYHLSRLMEKLNGFRGNFEDFWNTFRKDMQIWTPFFSHLKEAWAKRNHPNLLFIFYEEMIQDLPSVIQRVSEFLGKETNEEQVIALCEHLKFDQFSKNKAVQLTAMDDNGLLKSGEKFIRKGKSGGWREYFDYEMTIQAERWIAKNLEGTDLRFPEVTASSEDQIDS